MDSPYASEDEIFKVFDTTVKLCICCEGILRATSIWENKASTGVTFETLQNAAVEGCVFCRDVLENARIRGTSSSIPHDAELRLQSELLSFVEGSPSFTLSLVRPESQSLNKVLGWTYYSTVWEDDTVGKVPESMPCFTGSKATINLVRSWYDTCLTTHEENTTTGTWYPKRLLEIVTDAKVRLFDTENQTDLITGGYATLSHCWGSVETISLEQGTQHELIGGVDISQLPQTFRQALRVVLHLGIRFLWIDRLCIYQDSVEDWEEQGLSMKDVYKNARVTIAATGAKDGTGGLFHWRNGADRKLLLLPYDPWQDGRKHFLWRGDIHGIHVDEPLSRRAWAFQERILSPRTVHFGSQEVAWECEHTFACESFREVMPPKRPNIGLTPEPASQDVSDFYATSWSYLTWTHWYGLVARYASTNLTFDSDRVIAFAGVVQMILERTSSYTYHAGIWADSDLCSVAAQLLWTASGDVSRRCPFPSLRVPSWSPFFYEKPERLDYPGPTPDQDSQLLISIRRVQVQLTDPTQPAGNVLSGKLEMYGIIRKAVIVDSPNSGKVALLNNTNIKVDWTKTSLIQVFLDRRDHVTSEATGDVYLVPLLFVPYGFMHGLVLQQTENELEFQRLGLCLWNCLAEGNAEAVPLGRTATPRPQKTDDVKSDRIDCPPPHRENAIIRNSQNIVREMDHTIDWEDVLPAAFTLV